MKTENINEPLKSTTSTSYFKIFVALAVLGLPYVIGMVYLARLVLTPEDVEWLRNGSITILGLVTAYFGRTVGKGGLARTEGKIAAQVAEHAARTAVLNQLPQPYQGIAGDVFEDDDEAPDLMQDDPPPSFEEGGELR
jgi:hypothetical protein